jgi:hypothetical protein
MSQESVAESHSLDVLHKRRRCAVAIEEGRQAIGVIKAEHDEVPRGVAQAGIAEVEEYRPPASRTTQQDVFGLQVAVDEGLTGLLIKIERAET